MARAFGLRMLFGLSQATGLGSETLYQQLVSDQQARVNKVLSLDDELPGGLATQKSEVTRIWGEVQSKATKDKNFHGAAEQINVELIPLLDNAIQPAEDHLVNRPRYQTEFVPIQGEIDATLLDWPFDGAERVDLDDANTQVTSEAANHEYTQAMSLFDSLNVPTLLSNAKPLKSKYVTDKAEYDKERKAAETLLTNLKKHAQKAHVADKILEAETALSDAKDNDDVAHMTDARVDVATAKTACEDGKDYADEFAKYTAKRAIGAAILLSTQDEFSDKTYWNGQVGVLHAADVKAAPATRNYPGAVADVNGIVTNLKSIMKGWNIDGHKPIIKELTDKVKGKPVEAWMDADIQEVKTLQGQTETYFNNGAWAKHCMAASGVKSLVTAGKKLADRRIKFDQQKATTDAAVNGLSAHQPVAGRVGALQSLVAAADTLASRAQLRIEEGLAELVKIAADCQALIKTSDEAKEYAKERKAADTRYTNLGTHAAAANLTEPLATIKAELEQATKLAEPLNDKGEAVVSGNKGQDFPGARKIVAQAVKDLTAAETLAASLTDATASQGAAGSAANKGDIESAVTELQRQVTAIPTADAKLVAEEIGHINRSLEEALRLAETDIGTAKVPLQGAADILVAVKIGLAQHARITSEHAALSERLKKLQESTEPKAADLKNYIDPLAFHLVQANKQDTAGEWEKALAELRKGVAAAEQAEAAAPLRKKFDTEYARLETLRTPLTDPLKGEVLATMTEGKNEADKFKFPAAEKKLGKAEAQIDSARVSELATTDPTHTDFADLAKKMMKAEGGDKLLDDLVQSMPKSAKTVEAIVALAKIRFGVDMGTDAKSQRKSVKKLWEMMAKVPKDTVNNPSLKKVERREPTKNGGFYQSSDDLVVMNGRPGQLPQKFGANLKNIHNENQLPGVEVGCEPVNDSDLDYFDFATLHEVGHAVDDKLRFMKSREGQATFGGWTSYGANIDPIVTKVGEYSEYNSTPEQLAYISDLMLGMFPNPPTPPSGQEVDWGNKLKKVQDWHAIATGGAVWWSQPKSEAITLKDGLIYHEAYKKTWVSYPADQRKKGITGYQFRAPGEWFAELYASYHSGKLKDPGHPAVAWLKTLSAK